MYIELTVSSTNIIQREKTVHCWQDFFQMYPKNSKMISLF